MLPPVLLMSVELTYGRDAHRDFIALISEEDAELRTMNVIFQQHSCLGRIESVIAAQQILVHRLYYCTNKLFKPCGRSTVHLVQPTLYLRSSNERIRVCIDTPLTCCYDGKRSSNLTSSVGCAVEVPRYIPSCGVLSYYKPRMALIL